MSGINYEMIQQYLNGELTAGEAAAFEAEMNNDPALAKEVQLYRSIDNEMTEQQQQGKKEGELKATLQNLTGEFFAVPRPKVISIKKYGWYAAAAAAVIIAFVWFNGSSSENFDNKKLYAYYTKNGPELSSGQRGDNDTLLERGIRYFNNKEYQQAFGILQPLVSKQRDDIQLYLALGYCYMQTGNDEEALSIFNKVIAGSSVYQDQAYWYKALLLLKQNKIAECYTVLGYLSATADDHQQAEELMKKIEKQRKK